MEFWFSELHTGNVKLSVRIEKQLFSGESECQRIDVFDSEEGKALLRQWGVEGDYEGIGHCILGYRADTAPAPAPRKEHYIYRVR